MLYIYQMVILLVWFFYLVKKYKYSLHAILSTYFFFLMLVDVFEGILAYFFELYEFAPQLLSDPIKDNELGLIFCDGYLLPLTGIILCHYALQMKKLWKLSFIFAVVYGTLELIYIGLGYFKYNNWSIWLSVAIYLFATRIFTAFAPRLLLYDLPLPYSLRIAFATYSLTIYIGAYISGALINLYQWRPFILSDPGGDDRFTSLSTSVVLAILMGLIIPKVKHKFRPAEFITTAALVTAISYYAHYRGWLIFHKWNYMLTALYWFSSFLALAWYDHWESRLTKGGLQGSTLK